MERSDTFAELERSGWSAKADGYFEAFSGLTAKTHPTVLTLLGDVGGADLLDVACGPGVFLRDAAAAGAAVTGVDFAEPMVRLARATAPGAPVEVADAAALPFEDASFHAVTCLFGLWHMAEPDRALAEMHRVLRPNGRLVTATWGPPAKGFDLFAIVLSAIEAHGTMDVGLPPAPPPFRFADSGAAAAALEGAGFADVGFLEETLVSDHPTVDAVLAFIDAATVRAPMLIERQPDAARHAVDGAIREGFEARRADGTIRLRWPVVYSRAVAA